MARLYTRLLPVANAHPKPGEDVRDPTQWKDYMRRGEVALFSFDQLTGELRNSLGVAPPSPNLETCMAVRNLFIARRVAQGLAQKHPQMFFALYSKRGKWLETRTRDGVQRPDEGLRWALLLLQLAGLTAAGSLAIVAASPLILSEPIRWHQLRELPSNTLVPLLLWGLVLGTGAKLVFTWARIWLWAWHSRAALEPMGSPDREPFYRELAKNPNLLTPVEITLQPTTIVWPEPFRADNWAAVLKLNGFVEAGQYRIAEVRVDLEFWLNSDEDLTACIVNHHSRGMWLNAFTKYQDGSGFTVANKEWPGLDPNPQSKIIYLGRQASAQEVLEKIRRERPEGARRTPTAENLLEDYKSGWKKQVEWRRARGRTAEELKRIDERRAARKMAQGTQL